MTQEEILNFSDCQDEEILDFTAVAQPPPRPTLSAEQVVVRDSGPNTLVVAAPGAGKTEVLIQRHEQNEARNIPSLSLTFTVAAANEIKSRIPGAQASTIHAYCLRQTNFNWPEFQQRDDGYPKLLRNYIEYKNKETIGEVLVDEVQNLSPLMLDVINAIPKDSIFAVGDPYQSCYIGDWARNMWDAPAMGQEAFNVLARMCKEVEIKGCRRSSQHVINLLESLNKRELIPLGPKKFDTTLIVARTHKELGYVSKILLDAEIPHILYKKRSFDDTKYQTYGHDPKIALMVCHQCIGTEYRRVFIFDWAPSLRASFHEQQEDFNLLYTAAARAAEEVFTVNRGKNTMCCDLPTDIDLSLDEMLDELNTQFHPPHQGE
ncbi:hypothetical protein LCGC14_1512300 [marine sediment metagenome]|uniref:UvrD-like helicase C-terminal domain-containing protein n=1 Tax=marine sediment metagenome TaxID=412755 RepID=A0A0F9J150_9ZZZZ